MKLSKEQVMGIIRHGLTFVGSILIMKGLATDSVVSDIIGAVLTLTGSIWSIVDKK